MKQTLVPLTKPTQLDLASGLRLAMPYSITTLRESKGHSSTSLLSSFPQSAFPWRRQSEALCREKGLSQSFWHYACDACTPQAATQSSSIPPELCDLWGEEAYQGHNSCVCLVFGTSHRHGTSRALRHRRRTDTDVYEMSFASMYSISFSWKN